MKSIFGASPNEYDALLEQLLKITELTKGITSATTVEELSRLSQRLAQLNSDVKKLNTGKYITFVQVKDPNKRTS